MQRAEINESIGENDVYRIYDQTGNLNITLQNWSTLTLFTFYITINITFKRKGILMEN